MKNGFEALDNYMEEVSMSAIKRAMDHCSEYIQPAALAILELERRNEAKNQQK